MAERQMRWRPGVCKCVILQTHDPEAGIGPRNVTLEVQCPAHVGLTPDETFAAIRDAPDSELHRQADLLRFLESQPEYTEESTEFVELSDGRLGMRRRRGLRRDLHVHLAWTGTGRQRVLHATVLGIEMTAGRQRAIADRLAALSLTGKVQLHDPVLVDEDGQPLP